MASSVIANRMKPELNRIISDSQTGFLKGRSMGESTRLIYDLLHYTEVNRIPGLLMAIDFEKAFDSTSWQFLYNALEYPPIFLVFLNLLIYGLLFRQVGTQER